MRTMLTGRAAAGSPGAADASSSTSEVTVGAGAGAQFGRMPSTTRVETAVPLASSTTSGHQSVLP